MQCRNCFGHNHEPFLDLFAQPLSNSLIMPANASCPEPYFPLCVYFCTDCYFVQIEHTQNAGEIFNQNYVYYSSANSAFVEHARNYVDKITAFLNLDTSSLVVEAASNDGYLLQHFLARGIPHIGIEPTNTADVARAKGIYTRKEFFTKAQAQTIAKSHGSADLFIGNNVLAHVPDLDDFVAGISAVLKSSGVATLEFPHLLKMMQECQFDTIYHEHYSYISYVTIQRTFARHNLDIFRIEEIDVHGGSLRMYAAPKRYGRTIEQSVHDILDKEMKFGIKSRKTYAKFQQEVDKICAEFTQFLLSEARLGKRIWGFGAAAKGNTFLNYCGLKANIIEKIIDDTSAKQGMLTPGSRIPVVGIEELVTYKPDYVIILPWNWADTIRTRLRQIVNWDLKLITAIPHLRIFDI